MRWCARSCSTQTDSPASPTRPRRPSRCACWHAGSAARTSRRSASRLPGRCSGTRSSRSVRTAHAIALIHHLLRRVRALPRRPRVDLRPVLRRRRSSRGLRRGGRGRRRSSFQRPSATQPAPTSSRSPAPGRGAGARGRVLVVGQGFVGRLFAGGAARARRRGLRHRPPGGARRGARPDGPVDSVVLCAPRRRSTPSSREAPSSSSPPPPSTSTSSTGTS